MKRSGLPRPTLAQVVAWNRRPRKPLPKIGRKKRRELPAENACRDIVRERVFCEAAGHGCSPSSHVGTMMHHVWPEDRDAGRHEPRRTLWVCFWGHRWIHSNVKEAAGFGLLRPESEDVALS